MSVKSMLDAARGQLGYHEGPNNDTKFGVWYGMNFEPWCDMFVSWCGSQAGEGPHVGKYAYTPSHLDWFTANGKFGQTPKPGAIVFFKWPGVSNDICDHVGIVESIRNDGTIITIEGNNGDAVRRMVRSANIVGYGYPSYAGGNSGGPPSGGVSTPYPGHYVRRGDTGDIVRKVQQQLMHKGFSVGIHGVDGDFGPDTESAVRAFQNNQGIQADGVVGPITWGRLFK